MTLRFDAEAMPMCYSDDAETLETSLTIKHVDSGRSTGVIFDNMHSALTFMVQNQMWPAGEYLENRPELKFKEERELRGTEGTAIDGVTDQQILDGWRAKQGSMMLTIEIEVEDEALLDEFDQIDWS